ncbi:MAG: hypothetical protein MUD12_09955 [Spirochaetes bacterium]|nr:hypothetical protein [Spirochaetota bacterium]
MIVAICLTIGIFFTTKSFSQDDPAATTTEKKVENATDETKEAVKDDKAKDTTVKDATTKDASADSGKSAVSVAKAKTFCDGKNMFVNSKVLFRLYSKDNKEVDKIEYKIDGGEVKIYDSPFVIEQEGKHVIHYYGIDKIGNKEEPKRFDVIIDNTAPSVIVTTNKPVQKINEKVYISKDLIFTINSEDALSGISKIEYTVNGKDFQDYVEPFKIYNDGEINLMVKAVDNVGNATEQFVLKLVDETGKEVDLKEGAVKFASDNIPPVVTIKSDKELKMADNKLVANTDVKYAVTAVDNESGVASLWVKLDNKGEFVPYKSEIQFMTNGDHIIEAKAIDKVGNVSNVATFTVFVDTTPPETKIETVTNNK